MFIVAGHFLFSLLFQLCRRRQYKNGLNLILENGAFRLFSLFFVTERKEKKNWNKITDLEYKM